MAKAIKYADMTPEQKLRAEAWAERFGVPVEICPMKSSTGKIVTNMKTMLKYMSRLDYNIITKDHIKRSEITDEYRAAYLKTVERDRISDEDLEHAKATFASLR